MVIALQTGHVPKNDALQRFLDFANLVSVEDEPLDYFPIPSERWRMADVSTTQDRVEQLRSSIDKLHDPLRSHLLNFMVERMAEGDQKFDWEVIQHYYAIKWLRDSFFNLTIGEFQVTTTITLSASKGRYVVTPEKNAFLTAIESAKFGYIRRCPVCSRFFYASRVNQDACHYPPGRCPDTLKKRRQRDIRENAKRRKTTRRKGVSK